MTNGGWEQQMMALKQRQKELQSSLRSLDSIAIEVLPDAIDQGQCDLERDWSIRTLTRTSDLLHAVEEALDRLRTGRYGACEECGEAINVRRLQALPWAALCLKCQEEADASPERRSPESHSLPAA